MSTRWNPWLALRARPEVTLRFAALARVDALLLPGPMIVLDRHLDRRARAAALAHELVHLDRGGGVPRATPSMPRGWSALASREEARVDDEVARRLVPDVELDAFVARSLTTGDAVGVGEVAEEFDVAEWVAHTALGRARRRTGRVRAGSR